MIKTVRLALEKNKAKRICEFNSTYNVLLKVETKNSGQVYLGGSDVSEVNGFPLEHGQIIQLPQINYTMLYLLSTDKSDVVYLLIW